LHIASSEPAHKSCITNETATICLTRAVLCWCVQLGGSQIFNVTLPTITLDAKVYNPKVPAHPISSYRCIK
jgi:hypothetical protein